MTDKFELSVKTHFDAAHLLEEYPGKCSRLHGHRWDVEFVFEGSQLNAQNILVDFALVKQLIQKITDRLDHYYLNDKLKEKHPTAEFLAAWLYEQMSNMFKCADMVPINHQLLSAVRCGIGLAHVTVWESPECCVKYYHVVDVPGILKDTDVRKEVLIEA